MRILRRATGRAFLVVVLFTMLLGAAAPAAAREWVAVDAKPQLIAAEVLARPLGFVRFLAGIPFFIGAIVPVTVANLVPFTTIDAAQGDFQPQDSFYLEEAFQRTVRDPFDHVFTRPLGSFQL